jgi:large subunit ribosomal protein L24
VFQHTTQRPWAAEYWNEHEAFRREHNTLVEPIREEDWKWFKGDRVEVLAGKDKGKQGYINFVVQERNWVCVEGLNCKFKLMGKDKDFPGMGVLEEQPLRVTDQIMAGLNLIFIV